MSLVVSDTSPLRALAHLELLRLLGDLFEEVLIPPVVEAELLRSPAGLPAVDVRDLPAVRIQPPSDPLRVLDFRRRLDPGESEALALALEVRASAVLIDERAGRA